VIYIMIFEIVLFSALALGVGFAFCFTGYPFFRVLLPIWAFFAGLMFGITAITGWLGEGFLTTSTGVIFGFFIGLFLAAIAYFAYSFAVVLFGATVGYAIGSGLFLMLGIDEGALTWLAGIATSIVFALGFMFLHLPRLIIMITTALAGAMAIITGAMVLFGQLPPDTISFHATRYAVDDSFGWLITWIILSGLGFAVQYTMHAQAEDLMEEFTVESADVTPVAA
jgi:hypothetical protein